MRAWYQGKNETVLWVKKDPSSGIKGAVNVNENININTMFGHVIESERGSKTRK